MRYPGAHELPPEQQGALRRAVRLEWLTIAYLLTAIGLLYLVLGSSQATKAAWLEDVISLLPPIAFLVANRVRQRAPTAEYPFAWHGAVTIGYLVAALALVALGGYLLIDSLLKLVHEQRPPIGLVEVFGVEVWLGWLMVGALVYTGLPPIVLGRLKDECAQLLHDKVLHADARMNRADWMTAMAAILGVLGVGLGLWWADAVAAAVIALDILRDGQFYVRRAVADLLDSRPRVFDEERPHPLQAELEDAVRGMPWIREALVRMRESGHVLEAQVWVVPRDPRDDLAARAEEAVEQLLARSWKLHDVVISPVQRLEEVPRDMQVLRS